MSDKNLKIIDGGLELDNSRDGFRYRLADHVVHQNRARSIFIHNLEFGDPVWDFLLDLYASEHLDRPATIPDVAYRIGRTTDLCKRYVAYLMEQGAILENTNRFTAARHPLLVSEPTKKDLRAWLDNCVENASKL